MSNETKRNLELGALIIGTILAITSAFGVFYVLPYRMSAAETSISAMQIERKADHDVLVRIDENVKALMQQKK
jgi:hypothetical protein